MASMNAWRQIIGRDGLYSLRGVLMIVAAFALLNALVRRIAGTSLSMDDAKTNLFTQTLQGGYQPDNPPLFEWLLILLQPITGGGLLSFLVLKYAGLIVAAGFLFAAGRKIAEARAAFVATIGAVLLYQIGWNYHQAFTHSALLVPAVAAGIWAVLAAIEKPGWRSALILGVALGISLLTKYNAALFCGGAVAAILWTKPAHQAFANPWFLLTPFVAAALVLPHGLWFLGQTDAYTSSVGATMGLDQGSHLSRAGEGAASLVVSTLTFFLPLGLLYWFLRGGPGGLWPMRSQLLIRISIAALALLAAAVVVFGISNVSERYLIPVLLPAYLGWITAILSENERRQRLILRASLAMAVLVVLSRVVAIAFPGPPFCSDCRDFIPYKALKQPIEAMIEPGAVLIVREENTGGNLVDMFPRSPVRVFTSLHLTNPIPEDGRPCYLVWSKDMIDPDLPLEPPIQYMETDPETVIVTAQWNHPFKSTPWRSTTWGVTPIMKDDLYRTFCTISR